MKSQAPRVDNGGLVGGIVYELFGLSYAPLSQKNHELLEGKKWFGDSCCLFFTSHQNYD